MALYDTLFLHMPTPVVALNRSIAIAEVDGPEQALDEVEELAGDLDAYHLFHASRGSLLGRLGRLDEARIAYESAIELAPTGRDRRFLTDQIEALN